MLLLNKVLLFQGFFLAIGETAPMNITNVIGRKWFFFQNILNKLILTSNLYYGLYIEIRYFDVLTLCDFSLFYRPSRIIKTCCPHHQTTDVCLTRQVNSSGLVNYTYLILTQTD